MSQEYCEFRTGNLTYEIIDGRIFRQGRGTDIIFLGACPMEKVTEICKEYIKRDGVFGETRTSKDSSGKLIYELLFYEKAPVGELEKEVKVGTCIVGKPPNGQFKMWISPGIKVISDSK